MLAIILIYLLTGLLFLVAFDLRTKRIRRGLPGAATETQYRAVHATSSFVGSKCALAVIILLTWAFWPAVAYGALESKYKESKEGPK